MSNMGSLNLTLKQATLYPSKYHKRLSDKLSQHYRSVIVGGSMRNMQILSCWIDKLMSTKFVFTSQFTNAKEVRGRVWLK